jgi:hypothetical protein
MVSGSQRWCVWKWNYLDVVLTAEFIKHLAPMMQFMLTREQLLSIDKAIVGLRRNSFNHPPSELWHKYNVWLSSLFARIEMLDQFWAAIREKNFLFLIF